MGHVTSAWRKLAETRVVAANLPLPRVIVPVDEIQNGKPDPEAFSMRLNSWGSRRESVSFLRTHDLVLTRG